MTANNKTRAQHYVPQFYLRHFADRETVRAYDKRDDKIFASGTHGLAQESYFYDLDPKLLSEECSGDELQIAEHALCEIEGRAARAIGLLLHERNYRGLRRNIQKEVAFFLAIQYLRTRQTRDEIGELASLVIKGVAAKDPRSPKDVGEVRLAESSKAVLQLKALFNPDLWSVLVNVLMGHIWNVARAPDQTEFITSDHPVAVLPHVKGEGTSHAGLGSRGVEIVFPLAPSCLLILKERSFHAAERNTHGRNVIQTADQVTFYNELQVRQSRRWLYAATDSFDGARALCEAEPELRDENRQRLMLVSVPVEKCSIS
ncbi:MAG: DUF4238 domain-containing protein [Fimbriimonadaceae bacterium]